jgi:hypothetical protein
MNRWNARLRRKWIVAMLVAPAALLATLVAAAPSGGKDGTAAKPPSPAFELPPGSPELIRPAELAQVLSSMGAKAIVFNVGPPVIYRQAHIPGAEYMGPAGSPEGLAKLRARAASLPRDSFLVVYCGCCPWEHCPNIRPAYKELKQMGFTRVKVLYIATSFGTDWVEKGYPTAKGE